MSVETLKQAVVLWLPVVVLSSEWVKAFALARRASSCGRTPVVGIVTVSCATRPLSVPLIWLHNISLCRVMDTPLGSWWQAARLAHDNAFPVARVNAQPDCQIRRCMPSAAHGTLHRTYQACFSCKALQSLAKPSRARSTFTAPYGAGQSLSEH